MRLITLIHAHAGTLDLNAESGQGKAVPGDCIRNYVVQFSSQALGQYALLKGNPVISIEFDVHNKANLCQFHLVLLDVNIIGTSGMCRCSGFGFSHNL